MRFVSDVHQPMFEHNGKQYIRVIVSDADARKVRYMQQKHILTTRHQDIPLDGNILTVKVPYRYNRVMCRFEGAPVQSLKQGDRVDFDAIFMGKWNVGEYSGLTWKMTYIKLLNADTV